MSESNPVALCRMALATLLAAGLAGDAAAYHPPHAYRQLPNCRPCPPYSAAPGAVTAPVPGEPRTGTDGETSPSDKPPQGDGAATAPTQTPTPAPSPAASTVASAPSSAAPSMVGDHFGNGYAFPDGSSLSLQGGLRRMKIAENVSPLPQDRAFFSFNHFSDSVFSADAGTPLINLQRYTVGVERTLFDGMASIEIRAPFTDGLNADQVSGGTDNQAVEFGDLTITPKVLLASGCNYKLSAGLGIQVPTADDSTWFGTDGGGPAGLVVENNAVHLKPFLGLMHTPNSRAFTIAYAQVDVDVSGYDLAQTAFTPGGVPIATITDHFNDPTFLYLDIQYGYWLYQSCCCCDSGITGIAPVVELHYATNLEDFDDPFGPGLSIDPTAGTVHILNMTAGVKFRLGSNTMLTVAAAAPLRGEDNRQFDWEGITQLQVGF